jgi:hypothetical protein
VGLLSIGTGRDGQRCAAATLCSILPFGAGRRRGLLLGLRSRVRCVRQTMAQPLINSICGAIVKATPKFVVKWYLNDVGTRLAKLGA